MDNAFILVVVYPQAACKYGSKCYQTKEEHLQRFTHPQVSKWYRTILESGENFSS